eukprot:gene3806-7574_t
MRPLATLPITGPRAVGKDVCAQAAQAFNVPEISGHMSGWITGVLELPPRAIKDAEGVGECIQFFIIGPCQDGAVEMAVSHPYEEDWDDNMAQRLLLKQGDYYQIPPGNMYRLENHSVTKTATVYWTIIKPLTSLIRNPLATDTTNENVSVASTSPIT